MEGLITPAMLVTKPHDKEDREDKGPASHLAQADSIIRLPTKQAAGDEKQATRCTC